MGKYYDIKWVLAASWTCKRFFFLKIINSFYLKTWIIAYWQSLDVLSRRHNKIMIYKDRIYILWHYRIIGEFPNHIWIFWLISECYCNTYLHNGRGNCQEESASGCGLWCYVNDGNQCYDSRPSSYGAPYDWSCQACREGEAVRELEEGGESEFDGE